MPNLLTSYFLEKWKNWHYDSDGIASYKGVNGFTGPNLKDFMNCPKASFSPTLQQLYAIDGLLIVNVIFKTMILVENEKKFFDVYLRGRFFL